MNFNVQLTTPEGKDWEIDEHYKENGKVGVRQIPFTYLVMAREILLDVTPNTYSMGRFKGVFFTNWRYDIWKKIDSDKENVKLNFFEKWLLIKLACIKYDISMAASLIKYIK